MQKVALDLASGQGSYQIIYADPYQVLAPYHKALADLNELNADPNVPKIQDLSDFIPTQLDAAGKFVDKERIYALPYDAPTMIWMYRKDVFEANRDRMQQDLGFDPMPSDGSTWEQYYETAKWLTKNKPSGIAYGSGHQAKQHDSLMNDFSNVLWAYGGDYFDDGDERRALRLRRPGRAAAGLRRGDRRRRHVPQAALGRASLLAELGLDGAGRGVPGRPGGDGGRVA